MIKFLSLVISGTVTGGIYSIMASGIVLTYTTSGIFNFSQAAIAFAVAYLYYQLHSGVGIPIVPACILSVLVFAPLMGIALDRLLLRRLGEAPVYARIVGTIGLLVALPNLMQWLVVTIGNDLLHLNLPGNTAINEGLLPPGIGPTPPRVYHIVHGLALTSDQLVVFGAALVSAIVLWFVLRHMRVGLEMRAVVDRRGLAGLKGVNSSKTSAVAWVLTMVLAGLGGILISPLFSLNSNTFTLVVLGSLAAVVLGGLRSLPIAFIGGLLLGVVQDLVAGYSTAYPGFLANLNGLSDSVPYLLVLILGLLIGRDRSRQAGSVAEDRHPTDHRTGMSLLRRQLPWVVFVVVLMGYGMHWFPIGFQATNYAQTIIAQGLATSIILLSFVVVTGMGGMVSLAQATFVTAGGFAAGWALDRNWGINVPFIASHGQLNFFWAVIIGAVVAAAIGVLIALAATRLGAVYLALWSLAACFFFSLVPFDTQAIGQGQLGWTIRDPALDLFGWHLDFGDLTYQILLFIAVFGLIALVIHLLLHSATGRATLAVRSSPTAALAAGIRVNRNRVLIFAISAAIAGVGGVMLSLFSFAASNSTAPPLDGLVWLAFAVVFGVRRPGGALLAGLAVAAGTPILNEIATVVPGTVVHTLISSPYFLPILFGMGAITLAQAPDGVLALSGTQNLLRRRAKERAREQRAAEAAAAMSVDGAAAAGSATTDGTAIAGPVPMPEGAGVVDGAAMADRTVVTNGAERTTPAPVREPVSSEATFAAQGIVAGYDDAEVLHGVGLELRSGQIVALLGANGAGKSTFCSVLAGTLQPSRGTVYLKGTDVTAWPSYRRARAGVDMVPEARGIFPGLSVEENLALALPDREERERAYERFPVLGQRRNQTAGVLSGGEQQMLALAPALAKPPAVLIADEPTLGLAPLAAEEVIRAIVELKDLGAAVLLVEENAENALRLGNQLVFMELGNITWTGTPAEMDVGRLSATYLGGNESEPLGTR
jgi:ABC-type branched-subunit amino acid transport system ATPase component/branched-subunit amino acid ABC-type transport system permease component